MEKETKKYILPAGFGRRRRLVMLVIFAAMMLAGLFWDLRFFGIGLNLLEELTLIPRVLVYFIFSVAATKILMWIYRKFLRYRPLEECQEDKAE
ncbi:MAG: hypothetical protein LUF35_10415 [Lachnospiraceae bacterium]|nr:hypothetical protein [Lachnospiraceae bacterium]